jgi:hypothetical protein
MLRPNVVVDNTISVPATDGHLDYGALDRPTFARQNAALKQENLAGEQDDPHYAYLDVPAFLRRQAD